MANQGRDNFLFARFAWTVLCLVKTFVLMPRPTTLLARYRLWEEDDRVWQKEQDLASDKIDRLFGGGGRKSASPRATRSSSSQNHSRSTSERGRGDSCEWGGGHSDWDEGWSGLYSEGSPVQDQERGLPWGELDWNYGWFHRDDMSQDEVRGRRQAHEEDGPRYCKRRRLHTSQLNPPVPIASLADTALLSGASASPCLIAGK